ncbi:MAG: hypothetical protein IIZ10_00120 [Solobacterium sp.]|jgi:single-stranded DNA-binding protein|nr:hypothetical protein [Solobacterium sp.]MBQ8067124.1 hypothetical protein [Solobacterium sp.]
MVKDYFSFETIRDKNGEVVCYHVTAIGTIDKDGETRIRSDLGDSGTKKMAFGKLTVRGRDHMIGLLLRETGSRVYWRSTDDQGSYAIISFAAREKHAEEIYNLNEGDRVLIEGRAYIRQNSAGHEDRLPELSITVSSSFLLGRRRRPQTMTSSIIPQKIHSYDSEPEEKAEETFEALPSFAPMQSIDDDDAPMMSLTPMDNGVSSSEEKGDLE